MFVKNKSTKAGGRLITFLEKFYLSFISLLDSFMTNFSSCYSLFPPSVLFPSHFFFSQSHFSFPLLQIYKMAASLLLRFLGVFLLSFFLSGFLRAEFCCFLTNLNWMSFFETLQDGHLSPLTPWPGLRAAQVRGVQKVRGHMSVCAVQTVCLWDTVAAHGRSNPTPCISHRI